MDPLHNTVYEIIKTFRDREHPISGRMLAERLNLKGGSAEIREIIHALRVIYGKVEILANQKGYWWSDNPKDWQEYLHGSLSSRAKKFYEVENAYKKALKVSGEQVTLNL